MGNIEHIDRRLIAAGAATLAYSFNQHLHAAELQFGPRVHGYTFCGVEFCAKGPYVHFLPAAGDWVPTLIRLSEACMTDPLRADWQLAHEVVHLLSPTGQRDARVIEEGLATWFQEEQTRERWKIDFPSNKPNYVAARDLIVELFSFDRDVIRKARSVQSSFNALTPDDLQRACSVKLPERLVDGLLVPFQYEAKTSA